MPTPPDPDEAPLPPGPYDRETGAEDLWFLPVPAEEAEPAPPPPPRNPGTVAAWARAEAALAGRLARVAMRFGALDERLRRGPEGWRQRLALLEAAELCWFAGDRLGADRLALWVSLRLAGVQEDAAALARAGWAARRLAGGPGPGSAADRAPSRPRPDRQARPGPQGALSGPDPAANGGPADGIADFLGRQDVQRPADPDAPPPEGPAARMASWSVLMREAADLHPITRACLGFHRWPQSDGQGPGERNDRLEAAVTAARLAAADCRGGAVFLPQGLAGPAALRPGGEVEARLERWYDGAEQAILAAMRQIDRLEAWHARAEQATAGLSGRTPPRLLAVLCDWPLVSAPMAERLTGASRAAVQRNLAWLEQAGLIREMTGQGRFRFWAVRD